MDTKRVRMIGGRSALKSIRDLGITLIQGIGELVDNSVDAGAKNIDIIMDNYANSNGNWRIIVQDDGCGISEEIPNSVQHALRFGGRIPLPGKKQKIGKYGFGLSQTAICLTKRTKIFSKTKEGNWRSCYLDIEELEKNKAYLPEEIESDDTWRKQYSDLKEHDSGTIVCMEEIDRAGYSEIEWFERDLKIQISRIHRYSIDQGLKIRIKVNSEDNEILRARDPILQMANSIEVLKFGIEDIRAEFDIIFDGQDFGNNTISIIDPETGLPAKVNVRMINSDPENIQTKLGLEYNNSTHQIARELKKYGFATSDQGFYIVRSGREIAYAKDLGIFTKRTQLKFFHAEISFPTCLDRWFGIEVNKSEFRIDGRLKDRLAQSCKSTINQMAREYATKSARFQSKKRSKKPTNMELESPRLRKLAPRVKRPEKEIERLVEKKNTRIKQVIESVERSAKQEIALAKDFVNETKLIDDELATRDAISKLKQVERVNEERIKDVKNRFKINAFFRKNIVALPSDDMYAVEDFHDEIWVNINSNTKFYQNVYLRSEDYPEMTSLLDLMLFSIAYSEANKYNSEQMVNFWKYVRKLVSRISTIFVSTVKFKEDNERNQKSTFRTWEEVVTSISELLDIEIPKVKKGNVSSDWYKEIALKTDIEIEEKEISESSIKHIVEELWKLASIDIHPKFYAGSRRISLDGAIALEEAIIFRQEMEMEL